MKITTTLLMMLMCTTAFAVDTPLPIDNDGVIDDFVQQCQKNDALDGAKRDAVAKMIKKYRAEDAYDTDIITHALSDVYPTFSDALDALGEEETDKAVKILGELQKSKDPYLAAHAAFFQARAYIMDDKYEQALPLVTSITNGKHNERTLYRDEAMFLEGVCQAKTLQPKPAMETLQSFLRATEGSETVSERMRVGAMHLLNELAVIDEGSIIDVQNRMEYSYRRLALKNSGKRTQEEQDRIIAMLDKLIEEAENKEGGT